MKSDVKHKVVAGQSTGNPLLFTFYFSLRLFLFFKLQVALLVERRHKRLTRLKELRAPAVAKGHKRAQSRRRGDG